MYSLLMRKKIGPTIMETTVVVPQKDKIRSITLSSCTTLGYISKELHIILYHKNMCSSIFIATLCMIARK